MTTIIVCCWCNRTLSIIDTDDRCYGWEHCPHCRGSFSFAGPQVIDLGGGI
jgi:hypothetical protein